MEQDLARVVAIIDEVDGAARFCRAGPEHGLVHVMAEHPRAAERGEEGGMDVDDLAAVLLGDLDELEIAREHDEIGVGVVEELGEGVARDAAGDDDGLEAAGLGAIHAGAGARGDDERDAGAQAAVVDAVLEVEERAPAAGEENNEVGRGGGHEREVIVSGES